MKKNKEIPISPLTLSWKSLALVGACAFITNSASALIFDIETKFDESQNAMYITWELVNSAANSTWTTSVSNTANEVVYSASGNDSEFSMSSTDAFTQGLSAEITDSYDVGAIKDYLDLTSGQNVSFVSSVNTYLLDIAYDDNNKSVSIDFGGETGSKIQYVINDFTVSDWYGTFSTLTALTLTPQVRAVSAIPEPATFGLLGFSALGIVGFRRAKFGKSVLRSRVAEKESDGERSQCDTFSALLSKVTLSRTPAKVVGPQQRSMTDKMVLGLDRAIRKFQA